MEKCRPSAVESSARKFAIDTAEIDAGLIDKTCAPEMGYQAYVMSPSGKRYGQSRHRLKIAA